MTLIEFFDSRVPINNMAGALLIRPERVIFVGDDGERMKDSVCGYREILRAREIPTELSYEVVSRNSLTSIITALQRIVSAYTDCVFDLRGGDELYLVGVGCVMEKNAFTAQIINLKRRITEMTHPDAGEEEPSEEIYRPVQAHRVNLQSESIQDSDMDGNVCRVSSFDLSMEDYLAVGGGHILYERGGREYTYGWELTDELNSRLGCLWKICVGRLRAGRAPLNADPSDAADKIAEWNATMNTLDKVSQYIMGTNLHWSFQTEDAKNRITQAGDTYYLSYEILKTLEEQDYIRGLSYGQTVRFSFRDDTLRRILTTAGQLLELRVAMALRGATVMKNHRRIPLFHDIRVGVHIDWDDRDDNEYYQSVNEIDVLAMKGGVPVFISCKNGSFTVEELYKLDTVARRFGSDYAVKILVAPAMSRMKGSAGHIEARARNMGIRIIRDESARDFLQLIACLKS